MTKVLSKMKEKNYNIILALFGNSYHKYGLNNRCDESLRDDTSFPATVFCELKQLIKLFMDMQVQMTLQGLSEFFLYALQDSPEMSKV